MTYFFSLKKCSIINLHDLRIITMLISSLHPVVCRGDHILFSLFVFACVSFCFVLSSSCVPYVVSFSGVSIVFITPSVFSNDYNLLTDIILIELKYIVSVHFDWTRTLSPVFFPFITR